MKINFAKIKCGTAKDKQTFGLKIDKTFYATVAKGARTEVFDSGIINPIVWKHTQNYIKRLRNTFPKGELSLKRTKYGMIPVITPIMKGPLSISEKIELKTILNSKGTIHGKDIRNLALEAEALEKKLFKPKSRI